MIEIWEISTGWEVRQVIIASFIFMYTDICKKWMEEIEEKDDVIMLYEFNYFISNKIFVYYKI